MSYIPPKKAKKLVDEAVNLIEIKNYADALSNLKQAIEVFPNYYDALILIGRIYYFMNKWGESLEAWKKILETFDSFVIINKYHPEKIIKNLASIWHTLGLIYFNGFKNYSCALYCLKKSYDFMQDNSSKNDIDKCLRVNPKLQPEEPVDLKTSLLKLNEVQEIITQFERDLIECIKPYDKVSIEKIAEQFFPAPFPYRYYFINRIRISLGLDPLLWFKFETIENKSDLEVELAKTAQIVESAIESIKANLKKLIQQKKIHGKIVSNPDEFGSYFIKMEEEIKWKALKDNLLEIEEFFEEFFPIVFYIPPSVIRRIDEIIAEAKRFNFDLLVKKAENLKNDFYKTINM